MEFIEISNHPIFESVKRKIRINSIHEYPNERESKLSFTIFHFSATDEPLTHYIENVTGEFTVRNTKIVHPPGSLKMGNSLTEEELADEAVPRIGEYDLMKLLVKQPDVDSNSLAEQQLLVADANNKFNDYSKLYLL